MGFEAKSQDWQNTEGELFLLIKRMKRPTIDFVLHHHTEPSQPSEDDGLDYHKAVNQSECIY